MRRASTSLDRRKLKHLALLLILAGVAWYFREQGTVRGPSVWKEDGRERVRIETSAVRVVDGDTFEMGGRTIRILGIDTPEIAHPEHGYRENQAYGPEATEAARRMIAAATSVEYLPYRNDTYGRLLAHVFIDGKLYAVEIIREHLAWETISHYGDNGFPDLAAEITRAAREAGTPPFEPPWQWRRRHTHRSAPVSFLPVFLFR